MTKVIFKVHFPPGDTITFTAALRDLHNNYPGEFITDVNVYDDLKPIFEGNPYITKLNRDDPDVQVHDLHYDLINRSNQGSYHFIHAFRKTIEQKLGMKVKQGDCKGDIYIREEEKRWYSAVREVTGDDRDFWIVDAGHKSDVPLKAWPAENFQKVIDHFKDKIQFVQIGHKDHHHPDLKGVINLVGKTDIRQLIRLVYHSVGVLTPVSLPMVMAAAVPVKWGNPRLRSCVVIAGGREPNHWHQYPGHQYLHTISALPCCEQGGCWIAKDCTSMKNGVPKCMRMITVNEVISAIKRPYLGGILKYKKGWKK